MFAAPQRPRMRPCRSSSSTTATTPASAPPPSPPGTASRARCATVPRPSTCLTGGHCLLWRVEAESRDEAIALLPAFVAARTEAVEVREVEIP